MSCSRSGPLRGAVPSPVLKQELFRTWPSAQSCSQPSTERSPCAFYSTIVSALYLLIHSTPGPFSLSRGVWKGKQRISWTFVLEQRRPCTRAPLISQQQAAPAEV
ncbi:hypothetical protein NDU88_003874 [Pleurodeles waltl]|uniref:Uncharacterized protein n=1 Tax=Pleurodeles waltl TaxID=8319 RepID=A0AAV7V192_PLEWA|nr:hypothetical protein NDU88_003874 [Pleurodeles waltl]